MRERERVVRKNLDKIDPQDWEEAIENWETATRAMAAVQGV